MCLTATSGLVLLHAYQQKIEFVGQWPHQSPLKSIPRSGRPTVFSAPYDDMAGPTVAIRVPCAEAPSERKEQGEVLGGSSLQRAATCAFDASYIPIGSCTRGAPLARVVTGS